MLLAESVFNLNPDFIKLLEGVDGLELEVLLVCDIEVIHEKLHLIFFSGLVDNSGGFYSPSSKEVCS